MLVRAWILGVLDQEEYEGGATWENLRKALRELNYIGIAAEIGRKQTELMTPFLYPKYNFIHPQTSH